MKIVIVGAGALGGFIGASLQEAGEDVTLIANSPARIRLINQDGLYLAEGARGERCVRLQLVSSIPGHSSADLIFLAVKSYQTREAIRSVTSVITDQTHILTLQNGLGNVEAIADEVSPDQVSCGITYHSVQHVGPNRLRYRTGIKPIQVAPLTQKGRPGLERVISVFSAANLKMELVPNIEAAMWQKLLHNAVINPVSAATGLTCRELLEDEDLQAFMRSLCDEILTVMRVRGIPIVNEDDPYQPLINSQKALGKNRPSMWQDLSRGRYTEVDAINGAVIREAEKQGIPVPLNWGLVRFIHSRERWKIEAREQGGEILRKVVAAQKASPTLKARGAGMPQGRVPLKTAPRLKELLRAYYRDLESASKDPGRQVAWASGLGPVEILRAFGLATYFPENHACLIGASRQTGRYIPRARAEGYSQFISSAMACDIGAMLAGDSPLVKAHGIGGPPPPDVIAYSTNNGHDLLHWFEYYGRHFGVPVLGLHPSPALDRLDQHTTTAASQHLLGLIDRLEAITVRRLDLGRLREVVQLSASAARLWGEILDLARHVPSPLTFFDMLVHMAPIVLMRGTPQAVEYYQILKAELEDRVASNLAAVPGERFRLFWEGPPIWFALRPLAKLFLEHQVAVVASTFCSFPAMLSGLEANNPIESMARAYLSIFPNRSEEYKARRLKEQFQGWGIDAAFFHEGRTCPEHSNVRYGLAHRLHSETGIPTLEIEADSHDPRLFSIDQVRSLLTDFIQGAGATAPASLTAI